LPDFQRFFDSPQKEDCSYSGFGANRTLLTGVPAKEGTYRNAAEASATTLRRTITFSETFAEFSSQTINVATDVFAIRIDSITDQEIKGTLTARYDDRNQATGSFAIKNCMTEE
jgi:hypothetical protein